MTVDGSADIIKIADHRRKSEPPRGDGDWLFDLSVFADGEINATATISSFNDADGLEVADRLRRYADALDSLAWLIRQQAEKHAPSGDGDCLCAVRIFESSKARVRIHDRIETSSEAHMQWLEECLGDVLVCVKEMDDDAG